MALVQGASAYRFHRETMPDGGWSIKFRAALSPIWSVNVHGPREDAPLLVVPNPHGRDCLLRG